jgi:hypothetical protein
MKMNALVKILLLAGSAVVVVACGGGSDDESGSLTPFSIYPTEYSRTGAAGCPAAADVVRVTVEGGSAPYRIESHSARVMTDVKFLGSNGSFLVTLNGGCFEGNFITVFDHLGRAAPLSLSYTE